jgi:hypothetical protein
MSLFGWRAWSRRLPPHARRAATLDLLLMTVPVTVFFGGALCGILWVGHVPLRMWALFGVIFGIFEVGMVMSSIGWVKKCYRGQRVRQSRQGLGEAI